MIRHISFFINEVVETVGLPVCSVCGKKYDYRSDALECCTNVDVDEDMNLEALGLDKDRSAA